MDILCTKIILSFGGEDKIGFIDDIYISDSISGWGLMEQGSYEMSTKVFICYSVGGIKIIG